MKPYFHPNNYGRTAKIVQRIEQDRAFYQACHERYFDVILCEAKDGLHGTKYQEKLLEKAREDGFEDAWRKANPPHHFMSRHDAKLIAEENRTRAYAPRKFNKKNNLYVKNGDLA